MATATRTGAVKYKTLLTEAKRLHGQAGINAHRRAKILCELFDDADFRADIGASDDFAVETFLNELVEDLTLGFLELRAMIGEFPDETAWADGKLATLYQKAVDQINSRKPEREERQRTVNRVTREQYDAVKNELKDRDARLQFVERQQTQAIDELSRLREENATLRAENERLKGRIEQLERLQNRAA